MLITRECDYAVRVVRALAAGGRMSVGDICDKEFITAPFAYKILKKLQKAEIVKGFRGVHGGYSLNRRAEDLTLYDIYTAIDPEFLIIDCLDRLPEDGEEVTLENGIHLKVQGIDQNRIVKVLITIPKPTEEHVAGSSEISEDHE